MSGGTTDQNRSFQIDGLHCGACVGRAEAALSALPGAHAVQVNLVNRTGHVAGVAPAQVAAALDAAGYPAHPEHLSLHLPDMSCASCVARIEAATTEADSVLRAEAQLPTKTLQVDTLGRADAVGAALEAAGYPVQTQTRAPHETEAK